MTLCFKYLVYGACIAGLFSGGYLVFGSWDLFWAPNSTVVTILLLPGLWSGHFYYDFVSASIFQAKLVGLVTMAGWGAFLGLHVYIVFHWRLVKKYLFKPE